MTRVFAEVDPDGRNAIGVYFSYDRVWVSSVKRIGGARFVPKDKGGPHWRVPLNISTCRALRNQFGNALDIGEELKAWAWREVRTNNELIRLSGSSDAKLHVLPKTLPGLYKSLRPYQRAGVKFLSTGSALIADDPGLGKTRQVIAAVFEAGLQDGPNLVVAPKTALSTVWEDELRKLQDEPVYVLPDGKKRRLALLQEFAEEVVEPGMSGWLVVSPAAMRGSWFRCHGCADFTPTDDEPHHRHPEPLPVLGDRKMKWNVVVMDECHKEGLRNTKSQTAVSMKRLKAEKRIAMTGTPTAGKAIQLFGILQWLYPDKFTSKWAWANEWLHVRSNGFGSVFCDGWRKRADGTKSKCERCQKGILLDKMEEFNLHLTPYILRRQKSEVAKDLPPKQYVDMWLDMTPKQAKQYEQMRDEAMVRMSETENLTANGVLAEYTRLKQFAVAACELRDDKVVPTGESNKLEAILALLRERGITGDDDEEGDDAVVIFSQFTEVIEMLERELGQRGIETLVITGKVKGDNRDAAQRAFQAGNGRVMLMNVQAGGVAITLDKADTVIFTDEWWAPDVQTQAEDRVHRISRIHRVTVYYLRSRDTVEENIMELVDEKGELDKSLLDDRRKLLAAA